MFTKEQIAEVYSQKFGELCRYALFFVADEDVSRDIVQDVFVDFFEYASSGNEISNVNSFLIRSVKNRCLNYIKGKEIRDKYFSFISNMLLQSESDSDSMLEVEEVERVLENLIDSMPELRGRIFKMSRAEGKTYAQIAEELSISQKTVEAHITKSLKCLREGFRKVFYFFFL